ncbi:MAG TPA: hypothetical protein V6C96_01045, partial [Vampirovibrionales bacterium]
MPIKILNFINAAKLNAIIPNGGSINGPNNPTALLPVTNASPSVNSSQTTVATASTNELIDPLGEGNKQGPENNKNWVQEMLKWTGLVSNLAFLGLMLVPLFVLGGNRLFANKEPGTGPLEKASESFTSLMEKLDESRAELQTQLEQKLKEDGGSSRISFSQPTLFDHKLLDKSYEEDLRWLVKRFPGWIEKNEYSNNHLPETFSNGYRQLLPSQVLGILKNELVIIEKSQNDEKSSLENIPELSQRERQSLTLENVESLIRQVKGVLAEEFKFYKSVQSFESLRTSLNEDNKTQLENLRNDLQEVKEKLQVKVKDLQEV